MNVVGITALCLVLTWGSEAHLEHCYIYCYTGKTLRIDSAAIDDLSQYMNSCPASMWWMDMIPVPPSNGLHVAMPLIIWSQEEPGSKLETGRHLSE